jgi:protein-tyrosine-phosphatase
MQKKVLIVCDENAGRSQMAEAFDQKYGLLASSAGTIPSDKVNETVVQVMKEVNLDLSSAKPKMLTQRMVEEADLVVTMGCSVEAVYPKPIVAQMKKKLIDWHLDDPKGKSVDEVRQIRDKIELKIQMLSAELLQPGAETASGEF